MESTEKQPGTILVVDDQRPSAELIRRWLEADGHTVIIAESGAGALEAIKIQRPDLVLLDIMIPPPTGFDVCKQIKKDSATRHIPVLLMSGLQDPANWRRGLEVGAAEFLAKPLQGQDVRTRVRDHLERSRKR